MHTAHTARSIKLKTHLHSPHCLGARVNREKKRKKSNGTNARMHYITNIQTQRNTITFPAWQCQTKIKLTTKHNKNNETKKKRKKERHMKHINSAHTRMRISILVQIVIRKRNKEKGKKKKKNYFQT